MEGAFKHSAWLFIALLCVCSFVSFSLSSPVEVVEVTQDVELDGDDLNDCGGCDSKSGNLSALRYMLWTRSNPGDDDFYELVAGDADNLANSGFVGSRMTYMLHPGWKSSGSTGWILEGKTKLLTLYDCNVISVDWGRALVGPNYVVDVWKMYKVAARNAELIDWLAAEGGLKTSRLELAGHSLGGQSVGVTATYTTAGRISRVTGLDPAGPLFYRRPKDMRLDKSDADFVDVLHVNGCPIYGGCYATGQQIGHVDFYPNGGAHQPGCVPPVPGGNIIDLIQDCSHEKVHQYWLESLDYLIDPTGAEEFISWPCSDYELYLNGGCTSCGQGCLAMGFYTNRSLEGRYYLTTHRHPPYAKGNEQ